MKKITARKIAPRKIAWALSLATVALAGTAYAQQNPRSGSDGSGVVTRAEAEAKAAAMFARMDANKDGKLDQADREARRTAMFDRLDTDKNGQISRSEFAARPQRGQRADAPQRGERAEAGKEGKDGKRWGGHGRGHHGGRMMGMMGRMADADKDGAITQAEFTAAHLRHFDRIDANKDGQITREERQAARQAMREQWKAKRGSAPAPATGN